MSCENGDNRVRIFRLGYPYQTKENIMMTNETWCQVDCFSKAWHPSPFSKEENSLENLMANLVIAYWLSSLAQNWVPAPKAYLLNAGHGNNDSMDLVDLHLSEG